MQSAFCPADTDPAVYRRQVQHWRSMTPAERLKLADHLSADVTALAVAGIKFERPDATTAEIRHELARRRYGNELADAWLGPAPAPAP